MKSTRTSPFDALAAVGAVVLTIMLGCGGQEGGESGNASLDLVRRSQELRAVPYVFVSEDTADVERSGVLFHTDDRTSDGYNLYCAQTEPRLVLIDMAGNLVHEWSYPVDEGRWQHGIMMPNGDAVIIHEYRHVLRLDWDSNLLWETNLRAHHDIAPLPDGTFYVIGLQIWPYRGLLVRQPAIVRLSGDGSQIDEWSAHEHLDEIKQAFDTRSFLDTILDSMLARESWLVVYDKLTEREEVLKRRAPRPEYEYFHMNSISVLPLTELGLADSRFREGNLLVCSRHVNQIAVLDGETMEILWVWGEGDLEWPHHPTMLDDGTILVFDNGVRREYSRVLELNPVTERIEWEYTGDPRERFFTYRNGSAQRLPNGNTLICDGDKGRAFEVTREGEIVWEWLNPATKDKRRVRLYRFMRLAPEIVEPLLTLPIPSPRRREG